MQEIRFGREGEMYDDKWNPWLVVEDLVKNGKDIQTPDWREYPVFKENLATVDTDKIAVEADKWLATEAYQRIYELNSRKDDKEKTSALVCHGGSSTAFFSRVLNQQFPYMCAVLLHYPHTTISVIKFNKTPGSLCQPIIELLNDARHLM